MAKHPSPKQIRAMGAAANASAPPPGQAVDARGVTAYDPSSNVYALVQAESRRQDDLRGASEELLAYQIECVKEVADLRAAHSVALLVAEAGRLDAIRTVDNGAVTRAAEVAATQASTLAAQVATSAETLRTQVAAAAAAQTIALAAALEPVQKDIAELRKVQYEQAGAKNQVTETRTGTDSSRMILYSLLGVLATAALIISPHIH